MPSELDKNVSSQKPGDDTLVNPGQKRLDESSLADKDGREYVELSDKEKHKAGFMRFGLGSYMESHISTSIKDREILLKKVEEKVGDGGIRKFTSDVRTLNRLMNMWQNQITQEKYEKVTKYVKTAIDSNLKDGSIDDVLKAFHQTSNMVSSWVNQYKKQGLEPRLGQSNS